MTKLPAFAPLIAFAALAACNDQAPTSAATPAADNVAAPAPTVQTAKATGTVKAIDKAAGTVTLDHDPIAGIGWPAMTMTFKAAPALLESVQPGDKVAFGLTVQGSRGEVTSIAKR